MKGDSPTRSRGMAALFRIKSLDRILSDSERSEFSLKRVLGPVQLTLFGIGAIIGAGIFATIGTAAAGDAFRPGAGPALMLSFVITAVVCGFTALCYAEFASLVPIAGSAYTYSYATLGELIAWVIGWDLIIEYAVGNIAVAISWANYFKTFLRGFHIIIPDWISMDYRTAARIVDSAGVQTVFREAPHLFGLPIVCNLLAVAIVALISLVLIWGIRESARFNAVMVGIKIVVLTFFIIVGGFWIKPENWTPFAPNGWSGISAGAAIVFFAYIGFDAVSTAAEETRNPKRDLPIGIIASLIICTLFYVVVSAIFTGLISYPELKATLATEQAEPLTLALAHASPSLGWAVGIVAFGSVIAHTAVLFIFQLGQPRIFFSMSRDGLLPPLFRRVHPRFRTPHIATLITGLFVASFAAVASIDEMVDLTNIGTLFAFILVSAGIIVLRRRDPGRPRPFRVPGGGSWALGLYLILAVIFLLTPMAAPVKAGLLFAAALFFYLFRNHIFPALGILSCLYLIYYLPPTSWLRFASWLNIGFIVYAGYGVLHSRLDDGESRPEASLWAYAARVGAWLMLCGNALLFLMRGFDMMIQAGKSSSAATTVQRLSAGLNALTDPGRWLEPSWFLLVPLLLNTLLLGPMVVQRALRAGKGGEPARTALLLAVTLSLAGLFYLIRVAIP
ncbi:MAG TPA: amino acid permease [bacterium]|nr:amino acid permease [bacterium]HQG44643.1 amino acid permease [bacterium]HQI47406.1 amino acid permease [bacterium]HQJ63820.1 amino acid permease [bacterium]